jgi:hypothetical protein
MTSNAQIQYLLDRLAIQDVLTTYAMGHDDFQGNKSEGTLETWSRVFADDCEVDYREGGGPRGPWREMFDWMRGTSDKPGVMTGTFANWQHMLGHAIVTIDGDTAHARHDLLATHASIETGEDGYHYYDACTFNDDLVRTPDGWRIELRVLRVHWAGALCVRPDAFTIEK